MKLVGRIPWSRLAEEPIVRLVYPPFDVVVVRTEAGLFALEDACNHGGAALSGGWVRDSCLVCPLHQYAFDLATGALVRPKNLCGPQRTFVTKREGDDVVVYDTFRLDLLT